MTFIQPLRMEDTLLHRSSALSAIGETENTARRAGRARPSARPFCGRRLPAVDADVGSPGDDLLTIAGAAVTSRRILDRSR